MELIALPAKNDLSKLLEKDNKNLDSKNEKPSFRNSLQLLVLMILVFQNKVIILTQLSQSDSSF